MMNFKNNLISKSVLTSAVVLLAGCAATQTALEHRNLEVSTQQSKTIFLDPVSGNEKTIFLSIKNTSDESLDITPKLKTALLNQGYRVVPNPKQAHYVLQANILKVGKMSVAASKTALGGGYGSAIAGAAAGTALGALTDRTSAMIAGGAAGGLLGMAADALVKDVNYTMITDLQVSEKIGNGVKVNEQLQSHLKNGSSTIISQTYSRESQYQRYRTRIVSNADRVNLKFADARGALEQGLIKVITGIF